VTNHQFVLFWLLWVFGPTALVVALACVLSLLGIEPPKPKGPSWFKTRDW
jgi:hypothetical protein